MKIPTDVDEIGMSSRLLFAVPLLRTLVQAVAESDGDWNYLNVALPTGEWVGVARHAHEQQLLVSTNGGSKPTEPYPSPVHDVLLGHGFEHDKGDESYNRFMRFEDDSAFEEVAKLIVGTFQHAWGASLSEHAQIDLSLSFPPAGEGNGTGGALVH